MKITRSRLKQIIMEELERLIEAPQEAKPEQIDPSPLSPEDRHNVEARIEAALRSGPVDWSKKTDYELKRLFNDLTQKGLMPKGI